MKHAQVQSIKRLKTAVQLTPSGKAVVLSMFFILMATAIIPALGTFACLLAMLICSLVFGALFKPRINIRTELSDQTTVGIDTKVQFRIKNTSSLHSFCLSLVLDDLPQGWQYTGAPLVLPHLKPKSTEMLEVILTPTRRGRFTLPCPACYSSFPFHLVSFNVAKGQASQITVLPAYDYIQIETLNQSMSAQYAGSGVSPTPSHLPEYAGNRPFLSGDSLRHIDSRAWARLAEPVIKEYHNDMQRHCVLWLSDFRKAWPKTQDWDQEFEAMISLCASIAYSFGRNTLVDYLIIGHEIHDLSRFNADTRIAHILDVLAGINSGLEKKGQSPVLESCLHRVSFVYALYLGKYDAMASQRDGFEHVGIEFHTLRVSKTPDLVSWTASNHECHLEIDANAVLAKQVPML
jgi:uncharacterized protein (DUF58 family)